MKKSILSTLLVLLSNYSSLSFAFQDVPNYDIQVAPDHGEGSFGSWLYGEDNKPSKSTYSTDEDRPWNQNFAYDPHKAGHVKTHRGRMYEGKKRKYLKYLSAAEDTEEKTASPKEDRLAESLAFVSIWTRILNWLSCISGLGCKVEDSATSTSDLNSM